MKKKQKISFPPSVVIVIALCSLLLGVVITIFIKLPPEVQTTVSAGDAISAVGIVVTVVIIPLIIERHMTNFRSQQSVFLSDLQSLGDMLTQIWQGYREIYFKNRTVKKNDRKLVLSSLRTAQNQLDVMREEPGSLNINSDMQKIEKDYSKLKDAMTENFLENKKIKETDFVAAQQSYHNIQSTISKLKYSLYT